MILSLIGTPRTNLADGFLLSLGQRLIGLHFLTPEGVADAIVDGICRRKFLCFVPEFQMTILAVLALVLPQSIIGFVERAMEMGKHSVDTGVAA